MKTFILSLIMLTISMLVNAKEYTISVNNESEIASAKIELAKRYMKENNTMLAKAIVTKVGNKYIITIQDNNK